MTCNDCICSEVLKASQADHYTITLHEGDPGFDELLRKITEDDDEA